jgi:hypothetical protein
MDASEDRDVKLIRVSGGLFDNYFESLPKAIFHHDEVIRESCNRKEIERLIGLVRSLSPRIPGSIL